MRRISSGLGCVSERVGVHRHALAACIVLLLAGCSNSAEPYIVQVDCAQMDISNYRPPEQFLTFYYSDKTISQEVRDGVCLQASTPRKPASP